MKLELDKKVILHDLKQYISNPNNHGEIHISLLEQIHTYWTTFIPTVEHILWKALKGNFFYILR